ncbi:MAG TPA: NAD(P)-dependent oxidoreductase [Terracidiphilus sp.]|nr:NAD(P)-dependent oxidoreductase [Terracidiphilus sp.]
MIRVGYPVTLALELLRDFPAGIELIPVSDKLERDVEIDVWIPDPYPTRAIRAWPRLRGVKLIISMLAGTEWISPLAGPHVTICNARGAHNAATAEWALAAILTTLKYFPIYQDVQRSGVWKRRFDAAAHYKAITGDATSLDPPAMLEELSGKRVLLVGYGEIGKETERMLAPFQVELTRVARSSRSEPKVHSSAELDRLIPSAEIIVVIVPATNETRGLIGAAQFALMRQGTLLVNAARGAVVDTVALIEALNAGKIRAAIDVTDPEPLPEGHPLWSCPNLLITPHVAASSPQFARNALRVVGEELRRYINGEPLKNVVQQTV